MGHELLEQQISGSQKKLLYQLNVIIGHRALKNYAPLSQFIIMMKDDAHPSELSRKQKRALRVNTRNALRTAYNLTEAECIRIYAIEMVYASLASLQKLINDINFSEQQLQVQRTTALIDTLYQQMSNTLFYTNRNTTVILSDDLLQPIAKTLATCISQLVDLQGIQAAQKEEETQAVALAAAQKAARRAERKQAKAPPTLETRAIAQPKPIIAPLSSPKEAMITPIDQMLSQPLLADTSSPKSSLQEKLYEKLKHVILSKQALAFWDKQTLIGGQIIKQHGQLYSVPTHIAALVAALSTDHANPEKIDMDRTFTVLRNIITSATSQTGFCGLFNKPLTRTEATDKFYQSVAFVLSDDFIIEHQLTALDETFNKMTREFQAVDRDVQALRYMRHM